MLTQNANNFKKVFSIIKHNCGDKTRFVHDDCFKIVAKDAHVSLKKMDLYLSLLQDFGLVKYSMSEKYIELTPFGKKLEIEIKE